MKDASNDSYFSMRSGMRSVIGILFITATLAGCPQQPVEEDEEVDKPTLLLSSFPVCTEQILPETDLSAEGVEPIYLPLEVRINGVTGREASALTTTLSFNPARAAACLQSSVTDESGDIGNLRCMNNLGAEQNFSGSRRVSDAFYCTGTGRFNVTAKTKLNDEAGTVIESNPLEVFCLPADVFESSCERPEEPVEDMGLADMDLTDMDLTDMGEIPRPPEAWSVILDPEQEVVTNLSVQGSASAYPKRATYTFSVIDELGSPISQVPVKFYLDWSAIGQQNLSECLSRCQEVTSPDECDQRSSCQWQVIEDSEGDMGVEPDMGDMGMEAVNAGVCVRSDDAMNVDERCEAEDNRCESNLCLPPEISSLPLAIEPLRAVTNGLGQATVSVITSHDPGIYSVRAVAEFNEGRQEARTPNLTIWHQIPSQENISFRCKSPVVAGFFRRYRPNEIGGTDPLGYINYQRPASECDFQSVDRFTGRVPGVPVFFMSESGNIAQSVMSDEEGVSTAMWHVGGRSPADVDPLPEVEEVPQDPDAIPGHNARDGLVRLIAFTQGEARFIDLGQGGMPNGDRIYSTGTDVVPPHPEPYVDANDNGTRDLGEPYHDSNRNQQWDADVFGRNSDDIEDLKCFERWLNTSLAGASETDLADFCDNLMISSLTMKNPPNLQASIWTSTTVLSVGLPQEQTGEISKICQGAACSTQPLCNDAVNGMDVYLAPGGVLEVEFSPRDDNHNCVGIEGVELLANFGGDGAADLTPIRPSMPRSNIQSLLIGTAQSIQPEECYNEDAPTVPFANSYKLAFTFNPEPPGPEGPFFKTAQLNLSLKVPSYQVGDGVTINRSTTIALGLCLQ